MQDREYKPLLLELLLLIFMFNLFLDLVKLGDFITDLPSTSLQRKGDVMYG